MRTMKSGWRILSTADAGPFHEQLVQGQQTLGLLGSIEETQGVSDGLERRASPGSRRAPQAVAFYGHRVVLQGEAGEVRELRQAPEHFLRLAPGTVEDDERRGRLAQPLRGLAPRIEEPGAVERAELGADGLRLFGFHVEQA